MRTRSAFAVAFSLAVAAGCGSAGDDSGAQNGGGAGGAAGSDGGGGATTPDAGGAQNGGGGQGGGGGDRDAGGAGGVDASSPGTDAGPDGAASEGGTDAGFPDASQPDAGPPVVGDSVLTHHKNPSRDGLYVQPKLTKAAIGTLHADPSFTATLPDASDHVYAQPLFVDGNGVGDDLLLVATEADNVYALSATTGAQVWVKNLGTPVPLSAMPCGNIDPLGITGTPVIDLASRTIFLDAMTTPDGGTTKHHEIFALSIDTGDIKPGWPIDAGAVARSGNTTFRTEVQGQRGALAIVGGTLYVPYGGLYGDCGTYHGWVVGVSIADPGQVQSWATTANGGGAWTPGGLSTDGTSLYVSTGNTFGANVTWGGGDALIRLSTAPAMTAYFAPKNWLNLDNADLDMGTAPIVFDLPGSTPSSLAVMFGKDGNAYLLDRNNPGSVGAALGANAAACTPTNNTNACATRHVASSEIISAPALYTTASATYVAFQGNGSLCTGGTTGDLTTVKIVPGSPPTLAASWCASAGSGSPMVTTSDGTSDAIVWDLGAEANNHLVAFDGDTGVPIAFTGSATTIAAMRRYNPPIAAKGRIYVAADGKVVAFRL
jgi:hypothetical protein